MTDAASHPPAEVKEPTLQDFQAMAQNLVRQAELHGFVITIEQRPLKPLAMRNYETVVSVRERR